MSRLTSVISGTFKRPQIFLMVAEEYKNVNITCDTMKVLKENTLEDVIEDIKAEVLKKLKSCSVPIVLLLLSPKLIAREHLRLPVRDLVRFPLDLIVEVTDHILENVEECGKFLTKIDGKLVVPTFIPTLKNQEAGSRYEKLVYSKLYSTVNEKIFKYSKKRFNHSQFSLYENEEKLNFRTGMSATCICL